MWEEEHAYYFVTREPEKTTTERKTLQRPEGVGPEHKSKTWFAIDKRRVILVIPPRGRWGRKRRRRVHVPRGQQLWCWMSKCFNEAKGRLVVGAAV